jgi:DNA-binding transcriptional MerR regulator
MSNYTIKDLEKLSGIKAHTLRIWEQRYNILSPVRNSGNIRFYNDEDLKRILNISLLNNNGFKISHIAGLDESALIAEVEKLLQESNKESQQVDALVRCLLNLNEIEFENVLNNSIRKFGFESTIEKVVFPFLKQLGNMWQIGLVSPAQEHYISNLIRQKLIAGLDKISGRPVKDRSFLFFLPENELHELGLIYLHFLAKNAGYKCYYLGQSVPAPDLLSIAAQLSPDYLVSVITTPLPLKEFDDLVASCARQLPHCRLLFSGRLFYADSNETVEKYKDKLFSDFDQFRQYL